MDVNNLSTIGFLGGKKEILNRANPSGHIQH